MSGNAVFELTFTHNTCANNINENYVLEMMIQSNVIVDITYAFTMYMNYDTSRFLLTNYLFCSMNTGLQFFSFQIPIDVIYSKSTVFQLEDGL